MKTVELRVVEYKKGKFCEGGFFTEAGYTKASLTYEYIGENTGHFVERGDSHDESLESLKEKAAKSVAFNVWFENNWMKSFNNFGLENPVVTDEEGYTSEVNSIDDFVNNCQNIMLKKEYETIMDSLRAIAQKEVKVCWEDDNASQDENVKCIFVNNAFSTKMLQNASKYVVEFDLGISESDFRDAIKMADDDNIIIGHEDTAQYFSVECNRQTLHLKKGDILFVCEANSASGGRLPSGTEFLEQMGKDFYFRFIKVEIIDEKKVVE